MASVMGPLVGPIRFNTLNGAQAIKACAKSASWTKALRLLSTLKTTPGEISRVLHAVNTMSSGVEKFQHDG